MRQFKYHKPITGGPKWEALMSEFRKIRSKCVRECAAAFEINMRRTATAAITPAEISFMVITPAI